MSNDFLRNLSSNDRALLVPHLALLNVKRGQSLVTAGDGPQSVFFPINVPVSLVVGVDECQMEVAALGPNDVVNAGFALGASGRAVSSAIVQADGKVFTCKISKLANEKKNESLIAAFAQAQQRLIDQSNIITACTASHALKARLGRWLLRARDLMGTNKFSFTQDQVAKLLGVERSYLNKTIERLHRFKIVRPGRKELTILNPKLLNQHACPCYGLTRSTYGRFAPYASDQSCKIHSQIHIDERVTQRA